MQPHLPLGRKTDTHFKAVDVPSRPAGGEGSPQGSGSYGGKILRSFRDLSGVDAPDGGGKRSSAEGFTYKCMLEKDSDVGGQKGFFPEDGVVCVCGPTASPCSPLSWSPLALPLSPPLSLPPCPRAVVMCHRLLWVGGGTPCASEARSNRRTFVWALRLDADALSRRGSGIMCRADSARGFFLFFLSNAQHEQYREA